MCCFELNLLCWRILPGRPYPRWANLLGWHLGKSCLSRGPSAPACFQTGRLLLGRELRNVLETGPAPRSGSPFFQKVLLPQHLENVPEVTAQSGVRSDWPAEASRPPIGRAWLMWAERKVVTSHTSNSGRVLAATALISLYTGDQDGGPIDWHETVRPTVPSQPRCVGSGIAGPNYHQLKHWFGKTCFHWNFKLCGTKVKGILSFDWIFLLYISSLYYKQFDNNKKTYFHITGWIPYKIQNNFFVSYRAAHMSQEILTLLTLNRETKNEFSFSMFYSLVLRCL